MRIVLQDLALHHLWVVYSGDETYPLDERITALPITCVPSLSFD